MDGEAMLPYDARKPWRIAMFYAVDWALACLSLVLYKLIGGMPHTGRFYEKNDPSFMYPYEKDTVDGTMLGFIGVGAPILVAMAVEFALFARRRSWPLMMDAHFFFLGLVETLGVASLATFVLKHWVGRLRPSAFERFANGGNGYNESYPSGHTSTAFSGMTFLALFLTGKLRIFSESGLIFRLFVNHKDPFRGSFSVAVLAIILPMSVATFVGTSRLVDYAHDFSDVNAGAAIGIASACLGYFVNFPSLGHPFSVHSRPMAFVLQRMKAKRSNLAGDLYEEIGNGSTELAEFEDEDEYVRQILDS